jgi:hypothetical protein
MASHRLLASAQPRVMIESAPATVQLHAGQLEALPAWQPASTTPDQDGRGKPRRPCRGWASIAMVRSNQVQATPSDVSRERRRDPAARLGRLAGVHPRRSTPAVRMNAVLFPGSLSD